NAQQSLRQVSMKDPLALHVWLCTVGDWQRAMDAARLAAAFDNGQAKLDAWMVAIDAAKKMGLPLMVRDLQITGHEAQAVSGLQGKALGELLDVLHREVLATPSFNQKEHLLRRAKELSTGNPQKTGQ